MKINEFALERHFAKYEFHVDYLLSSSDCDGLPLQIILKMASPELLNQWNTQSLGYTESSGSEFLKQEIVKLYQNISTQNLNVMVPQEGIFLTMNALLEKGDHIIATFPGYQSLYEVAKSLGCQVSFWKPHESRGWQFDLNDLKAMVQKNTKAIVVNFPHNPTGFIPKKEEFLELIAFAKSKNLHVFSDEMYRFLEFDENNRLPSVCDIYEKGITLFGMSKTFSLAGARIGWIATQDKKLLQKISTLKDYTTICNTVSGEILAAMVLQNKDVIIQNNLKTIQNNLNTLDEFFKTYADYFFWVKPLGSTVCFPKLKTKMSSEKLADDLAKNSNLMLLPAKVYDYGFEHFRIGLGRENFKEALGVFEKHIQKYF